MMKDRSKERVEGKEDSAFTPHIFEVHGNLKYMHCSNYEQPCSKLFYKSPTLDEVKDISNHVPVCKDCG